MKTVGDRIQACSVTGVKPGFNEHGNETVRDALDMVHGDLAAQDRAWLGRLHGEQAHVRVDRAECLADADQGSSGADAKHQRVGQLPLWQLGEDFRAQHQAIFLHVPFRVELAGAEKPRLPAQLLGPRQRLVDVKITAEQHLGTLRMGDGHALAGQTLGHDHRLPLTFDRRDHRQGVAGVAADSLDDGVAGFQQAFLLRPLDHVFGDARLD